MTSSTEYWWTRNKRAVKNHTIGWSIVGGVITGIYSLVLVMTDGEEGRDNSIFNHFNSASRTEQIVQNTSERLMTRQEEPFGVNLVEKVILFDEQDSTRYELIMTHEENEENSSIVARIEQTPNNKGKYKYTVIKKPNLPGFENEWKNATITIGDGKKKIITAAQAEEQQLTSIITYAQNQLNSQRTKRVKSLKEGLEFMKNSKYATIAELLANNDENKTVVETKKGPTYIIRTKGYKITPETEIEITYLTRKGASMSFEQLEGSVQREVKSQYRKLGRELVQEARAYKRGVRKAYNANGEEIKSKAEIEQEEKNELMKEHLNNF